MDAESLWRTLFDRTLRGMENNSAALSSSVFDAFLNCQVINQAPLLVRAAFKRLINDIKLQYKDNAYHSFFHATHVVLSASLLCSSLTIPLSPVEHFAILYAALIHDIGHEGVFNSALVAEGHEAALRFNDVSVAEMNSIRLGLALLEPQISCLLTPSERRIFRSIVIDIVLHTDLADLYRSRVFKLRIKENMRYQSSDREDEKEEEGNLNTSSPSGRLLALILILKLADVSSLLQSFGTVLDWAHRFYREQVAAHSLGRGPLVLPETFDRNQISFFNNYCLDLVMLLRRSKLSPSLAISMEKNIASSVLQWKERGEELTQQWASEVVQTASL